MRLARRVAEHRLALREHRRHHGVLRRHDARLVEEDLVPVQPSAVIVNVRLDLDRRAELWNAWMCGSSRRRPITSPPGGGIVARPKRASSGPASRNDARIRLQSSSSGVDLRDVRRASTRTSFAPIHSTSAPRSASRSIIVSTSRMRGTFVQRRPAPSARRHAARIGSAPFLFPAARMRPLSGRAPSMTKASAMLVRRPWARLC